jgi:hypothetical protein
MRKYQKEWYRRNSEKVKKQTDKYKYELKEWFAKEVVAKASCIKCGESHPGCLDFHHRDPASKDRAIADMIAVKRNKKAILKEIDKCDILCANCHRKLHYEERR